ncbi:MAG: tetratricopeptide repeat protein [Bacteroidales bacterium]
MKKFILVAAAILFGVSSMSAQKGVDDGSKYGKGEDSIRCITNISLYVPYAKSQNYKDAYEFWKIVYDECPASSRDLYLYGARIIGWKITQEKDAAKQKELLNKLMEVYDKRAKYFGNDPRYPEAWILGRKGLDYVAYSAHDQLKKPAYEWLKKSMEGMNENTELAVAQYFANLSLLTFQHDPAFRDQYIQDYMFTSKTLEAMSQADSKNAAKIAKVKGDMDVLFAQSGAADCETLQKIYAAKVEENKTNLDWLKDAISLMRKVKCQEIDAYFAASNYAHKIEPTAESAAGLAQQSIKDKDYNAAIKYLDEAISMEKDNDAKADFYFAAAQVLNQMNQYSKARQYALTAAELKPNFGQPYILIGSMYAKSAGSIYPDDRVLQQVVYYAAVDKLEKARQVDPSVAADANRLINSYRAHFPKNEDIFMHGDLEKGKQFTVGGWIQERTTIR